MIKTKLLILIFFIIALCPTAYSQTLIPAIQIHPSTSVEVGEEVYLSATSTTYPDEAILAKARYEWDFGDGYYHRFDPVVTSITMSGIAVIHYFMSPGDFTVTLKVTIWAEYNSEGTPIGDPLAVETTTQTMHVTGETPMAGFEIQRASFHNRLAQYLYVQIPAAYRANTTKLKVSLLGNLGSNTVLLSKSDLASEERVFLDHKPLAQDDYVVIAELLNESDQRIAGGLWRDKFSKGYSGIPEVGIDENNSLRLKGNLFFPIGPYMTDEAKIANFVTQASINMLQTEGFYATHTPTTWGNYLDVAANNNLVAIGPGRGDYNVQSAYWGTSLSNRWKFNHNPDRMAEYVQLNKNKPAMFSWIWQDEPNMGGRATKVYPATLAAWSYIAHRYDSQHPVYNLLYGYDWTKYYGTAPNTYDYLASAPQFGGKKWMQDIFSFDNYPIQGRLHVSMNLVDMGPYAVYLDSLDRIHSSNKNLVPVLPALQPCLGQPTYYGVTEEQVYLETWMNVIHGAKGIVWFPYFDTTTIRWTAMKKFAEQMKTLAPAVLQPEPARTVTDDANAALNRVDTLIREYNGSIYIFAARVTEPDPIEGSKYLGVEPDSITASFSISGMTGNSYIEVVDESRIIPTQNGQFTDTFNENAVHIYRWPAESHKNHGSPKSMLSRPPN